MEKRIIVVVIMSIVIWSCSSNKSEKKDEESVQIDSLVSEPNQMASSDEIIFH